MPATNAADTMNGNGHPKNGASSTTPGTVQFDTPGAEGDVRQVARDHRVIARHSARHLAAPLHRLFRDLGFLQKPGVETKAARDVAARVAKPPTTRCR